MYTKTIYSCVIFCACFWLSNGNFLNDVVSNTVQKVSKTVNRGISTFTGNDHRSLKTFSWKNCGSQADPIVLKNVTVSPDPVKIPGVAKVSFTGLVGITLGSPLKMELEVKKKEFVWIEIPCIDDVGSCTYSDICSKLPPPTCPPAFEKYGIPCQCPIKANTYNLPMSDIEIPDEGIPSFLVDGDFWIRAKFSMNGKQMGCYEFNFSVTS